MAVKITDVVITPQDFDLSWQGIKTKHSNWNSIKNLKDWRTVNHSSHSSPLEVTVGEPIVVTVSAVDVTWGVINEDFASWGDIKNLSNWKAVLNYH